MKHHHCLLLATLLLMIGIRSWAGAPIPEVSGSSIVWPAVNARTINVHRADGSYLHSLPGNATTWNAPQPGDYFLVAATDGHWSEWQRSVIVTIENPIGSGAPSPVVADRVFLIWPPASAKSINVHRGDGSYVESLPGDATIWLPDQFGDYYLVAANNGDWRTWPRSKTVTVSNPYTADDAITDLTVNVYSQSAAEVFWNRVPGSGVQYQISKDGEDIATIDGTSWYSDDFAAGSTSVVSVAAHYTDGSSSNSRSVAVVIPAKQSDRPAIIGPHNYGKILEQVFGVYFGTQYREPLRNFATNTANSLRSASGSDVFPLTRTCNNGGEVFFSNPLTLVLDNCRNNSVMYSGSFNIHETYGDTDRISSNGFTIASDANNVLYFSGSLDGALSEKPGWYEAWNMEISQVTPENELNVMQANFSYTIPHLTRAPSDPFLFTPYFSGDFLLQSNITGDKKVTVSTLETFTHSQLFTESKDWNFTSGIVSISAEDGSRIVLNAHTGNKDTVHIQIANGAVVEQFEMAWDPDWTVWRQYVDLQ